MNVSKNVVNATEVKGESPPPPYFDDLASANARPVEPIPTREVGFWTRRGVKNASHAREMVTSRTKAWALVLVAGVAMGTLGGTILVHTSNSSPEAVPVVQEPNPASTSPDTTADRSSNDLQDTSVNDEIGAAQVSAIALENAVKSSSRDRRRRAVRPVQRVPRAYRVGVIR